MKLISININPKKLLKSKKSRSISRSDDPSSFSGMTLSDSSESSSSSSKHKSRLRKGSATPTSVLPSHLSGGDLYYDLVQAFKLVDSDSDGKITREELEVLLRRVVAEPPSEEEMKMLVSDVDVDGDGCISLEEFSAISSVLAQPACDAEIRDTFDFFDADHDGRITAEELFNVLSTLGNGQCTLEDCRRMIGVVDKNRDGVVCFEDFSCMMEQHR